MTIPGSWLPLSTRAEHACSSVPDATACLQAQPNPGPKAATVTPFPQFKGYICTCGHTPKCRHDHRLKQHPRWKMEQLSDGTFRWTTPAGRSYTTEPPRYPI
jgi:hypothetical protein